VRTKNGLLSMVGACAVAVALAACGSSTGGSSSGSNPTLNTLGIQSPLTEPLAGGKRGGVLNVVDENDFEHLDPTLMYYSVDYEVGYAVQSPLYMDKPNTLTEASPVLAEGKPEIAPDSKQVTVHLNHGFHFSPPVNREVTAEDVKYAFERAANPNIANPYLQAYFSAVEGVPAAKGGPIAGITAPNKYELVFKLTEPKAQLVVDALQMPITMPVPKEYAAKFDREKPSTYVNYQVSTGPYMLKNEPSGKVLGVGYVPGKSATLVRNPNWNASLDIRPAYLDEIHIKIGGTQTVLGPQTLHSSDQVDNELPAQSTVREAYEHNKSQLEISPDAGSHYIGVNNKVGPFKNEDLRKAFWAALNRKALDRARGGELVTTVMTHFIYPGIPGFEQAGGVKGPQFDFNRYPEGNMAVAAKYLKLAGYPSGKYTGGESVTIVGAKGNPTEQDAELVNTTLKNLGFNTKFTLVETATMYAKYCNVPKEEITVCPSVGWIADFADPQTVLNITFSGKYINETGNVNWGQSDVPAINEAAKQGELITGESARAAFWAKIDEKVVEHALAIPFDWDKEPFVEGSGVKGVGDLWDIGEWDYGWTSLK
jgi:peptide/nickel transport system substrate-binding protein